MVASKEPDPSPQGMPLPSAVNLPVPPPPPPPTVFSPPLPPPSPLAANAGKASGPPTEKSPAAEAEAYLKAYAPLLAEAIKRILDVSFAISTTAEITSETRHCVAEINLQSAAIMIAMILTRSGAITCQSAHGQLTDTDLVFIYNTARPLLLLAEDSSTLPALTASPAEKRLFLQQFFGCGVQDFSLSADSLAALDGFRLLAVFDQLNGCPLTSSGALTERLRHALLKYLHTLVDCDGTITEQERNCIAYFNEQSAALIEAGVAFAKRVPSAARRLKLSPFARPEVVIEPSPSVDPGTAGGPPSAHQSVEEILRELWDMTGLAAVKEEINSHINTLKVSAMRKQAGLAGIQTTNHMVFTGNPGTGKTTVARKLAKLYRELGVLSNGSLTEVDQSALVAGFVGQTAIKTKAVVDRAKGGVLFIDEAYALTSGNSQESFGNEAIETLLKYMEDYRDDLIVIVAGYEQPMNEFLKSNPGLRSRFNKFIAFSDYTSQELKSIFVGICRAAGYTVTEQFDRFLSAAFLSMTQEKPKHFGNGRTVRNLFDCAVVRQANRVVRIQDPSHADLMELTPEDISQEDLNKVLQ